MKNLDKIYAVTFTVTVIILYMSIFAYMNAYIDVTPGWTFSAEIPGQGYDPLLTYYKAEFWLVFYEIKGTRKIKVTHSPDGANWSSPTIIVEGSSQECHLSGIQWLQRPDSVLWVVWTGGTRDTECQDILYYSALTTIGWTPPQKIHQWEPDYYIKEVSNAPGGGLAVLGEHGVDSECFIQTSDKNFVWNNPVFPTKTRNPVCIDIFLDNNSVLWTIFGERHPISAVSLCTSKDGISWSSARDIVDNVWTGIDFLQYNNHYVFFYYKSGAINMIMSSDTLTWSEPAPVWVDNCQEFDPIVSSDGTMWALVENSNGRYLIQFSEKKFYDDTQKIRRINLRNRIFSVLTVLIIGIAGFLSERALVYQNLLQRLRRKIIWSEKQKKVLYIMIWAIPVLILFNPLFPIDYFTMWLTLAGIATVAGVYIYLSKEGEKYFKFFWIWALYTVIFWILAFFSLYQY